MKAIGPGIAVLFFGLAEVHATGDFTAGAIFSRRFRCTLRHHHAGGRTIAKGGPRSGRAGRKARLIG